MQYPEKASSEKGATFRVSYISIKVTFYEKNYGVFFPYVMNVLEYNWDVSDGKWNLLVSRKIGWLIYKKKICIYFMILK